MALSNLGRRIAIELFVASAIGFVLGLLGPFGTYQLGTGLRIAYWVFMMLAGHLLLRPVLVAGGWLAQISGMPLWLTAGIAIALGSLPLTLLIAWLFNGFDWVRAIRFDGLPIIYGQVLLISILVNWLFTAVFGVNAAPGGPTGVPEPASGTRTEVASEPDSAFIARLPAGFGPLRALGGEDHYVRAYGDAGSTLILIRLRDAIGELGGAIAGEQVHRSWWVARDAVKGRKSEGRAVRLVLNNGLEVPVARERVAALKSGGWF